MYIKDINFCNIKVNIDNNILKIGHPLKIKLIFNEDQYGCLVIDKREFLKQFFQLNTWC